MYREMERARVPAAEAQKRLGIRGRWQWQNLQREARYTSESDAEWFLLEIFDYQMNLRTGGEDELKDILVRYCLRK